MLGSFKPWGGIDTGGISAATAAAGQADVQALVHPGPLHSHCLCLEDPGKLLAGPTQFTKTSVGVRHRCAPVHSPMV